MPVELTAQIITVISSLLTCCLGGGFALYAANRQLGHQTTLERERRHVANMERIYQALTQAEHTANNMQLQIIAKISCDQIFTKEQIGTIRSNHELCMLIHFYAPTLNAEAEVIERGTSNLLKTTLQVLLPPKMSKLPEEKIVELFGQAVTHAQQISDAAKAAKTKLATLMSNVS
jgi:hypothetical protein